MPADDSYELGCQVGPTRLLVCSCFAKRWTKWPQRHWTKKPEQKPTDEEHKPDDKPDAAPSQGSKPWTMAEEEPLN